MLKISRDTFTYRCTVGCIGLFFLVMGFFAEKVMAYEAIPYDVSEVYEAYSIERPFSVEQWYLGTLAEFPEMYEFSVADTTTLQLSLRVPDSVDIHSMRPSLLLVRDVNPRGVKEVARIAYDKVDWKKEKDPRSGLTYYTTAPYSVELEPGVYKAEISTPNNVGKYMFIIGSDAIRPSFSTSFATVYALHDFYEVSKILMVRSPVVYYPLGILLCLGLLGAVWRYRARIFAR